MLQKTNKQKTPKTTEIRCVVPADVTKERARYCDVTAVHHQLTGISVQKLMDRNESGSTL